jgi:twitching motility protein PilI
VNAAADTERMNDYIAPNSAFDILLEYERLSLEHSAGVAESVEAPGLWRGIGFRIGTIRFIGGIGDVNEILFMPTLAPVPGTKSWLLGVANVRGNLVPVVDLRGFLEGERTPIGDRSRVLVARQAGGSVGLLVDEVLGQRNLTDENQAIEYEAEDPRYEPFIAAHYELDGAVWSVFNLAGLVRTAEFLQASA